MPHDNPYLPPQSQVDVPSIVRQKPAVWRWYVVYCISTVLMYLIFFVAVGFLIVYSEELSEFSENNPSLWLLVLMALSGIPFAILYAVAPFLEGKGAWIVGFITIGMGFTSPCCVPACVPLLIFWLKPETKQYFGV